MTVRLLTNIGRLWTGSEILSNAAVVTSGDRIAWVGPAAELPQRIPGVIDDIVDVDHVENLGGGLVTPGLIDAHTHPVYAGNRWAELAMRSNGSSIAEINQAGGGVSSTVTVTRGTDPWTLCNGVRERMGRWLRSGTTTIEAKTGYHLTRDGELADVRMLRGLEGEPGMPRVHITFLAAHAVPPEYFGRRADYIDAVGSWCADASAIGADSVDVYCEKDGFSEDEARWILSRRPPVGPAAADPRLRGLAYRCRPAGRRAGLRVRRHAARGQRGRRRRARAGGRGRGGVPGHRPAAHRPAAGPIAARQGRHRRARPRITPRAATASPRWRWSSRWPCPISG